jgi:hypothetical protein
LEASLPRHPRASFAVFLKDGITDVHALSADVDPRRTCDQGSVELVAGFLTKGATLDAFPAITILCHEGGLSNIQGLETYKKAIVTLGEEPGETNCEDLTRIRSEIGQKRGKVHEGTLAFRSDTLLLDINAISGLFRPSREQSKVKIDSLESRS